MQEHPVQTAGIAEIFQLSSLEDNKQAEQSFTSQEEITVSPKGRYLQGWRRHTTSTSAAICLFLVNIEVSVVGTALVPIVKDLRGVERMGWVITGYLITFTATMIIWAKLSDIFGRKYTLSTCIVLFTAFSGACGASQTMNQLIISRVFQGIGAAGMYAIGLTMGYEIVPRELYPIQGAQFVGATALGSLIGPLIGGGTSQHGQWRWAFLFNAPMGVLVLLSLLLSMPANFPHQGDPDYKAPTWRERASKHSLARLDMPGSILMLAATILIVAVLLEGGVTIAWDSATSIALFTVSGILWILFLITEWSFTKRDRTVEPIFPWRFLKNRAWMGTLLFSFVSGVPYNILIINIPQRFQELAGTSPMTAAVRLIPFNLLIAFTGFLVNIVVMKTGIPCVLLLLFGSIFQLGGLAWFCALPENGTLLSTIYGCEVLTGFGIGCVVGITLLMPPLVVEKRDLAISSAALMLFRALGGVLGLSITTTAFNNYLKEHLSDILGNLSTSALLTAVQEARLLAPEQQVQIRTVLSEAYGLQSKILVGFAAVQILLVAMIYRKGNQIRVVEEAKE